jgi:hypothetical protein
MRQMSLLPKLRHSIAANGGRMLGNKKASSIRGVRSEPTPAPIKAKPAEQKYHDEDDQECVRVHGCSSPNFFGAACVHFSRCAYWIEYGGKVDAFIDSKIPRLCEQRFTRRVSLAVGTNLVGDGADIPRENMRGGLSETPAGRRQRCRPRHRLGRLLVDVTYKSGAK